MLNILVVYAIEEERVHLQTPNCTFHYCKTGIGKVSATLATEKAIQKHSPDAVINVGTAGTVKHKIGSIHLCKQFIDRDMEKLQAFGLLCKIDFSHEIKECGFFKDWQFDSICNTGDTFLTSSDGTGDIFDMESYAVAMVCRSHNLPFVGIKCVTDRIGENSVKHWEDKLAEAQLILKQYVNTISFWFPEDFISLKVAYHIKKLDLLPHPEGGWYKEAFRSDILLKQEGLPSAFKGDRNALTSIYYLLANDQISAFHRIKSPETWYFHEGNSLYIHVISPDGKYEKLELSNSNSGVLQLTVPENSWFAAEVKDRATYSLVSCAVAPGFDFEDFEMADKTTLGKKYPELIDLIQSDLCKGLVSNNNLYL